MSLTEEIAFDKEGKPVRFPLFKKLFLSAVIILVALLSFGIGRLSVVGNREPVRIEYDASISNSQFPISNQASVFNALINNENSLKTENSKIENSTPVIASKNGSKYHYEHCPGAKQIKEGNRIAFATPAAAEAAGYTLATNCKAK
ncbi:MAG: hypothetical protein Q8P21_02095 [bacterium]|nr:hypothetical protein [bacterium]